MNRRKFPLFLIIFVLASCTSQIPPSASPLLPATATAMIVPTSGAIQVETPGAQFYVYVEPVGYIMIPGIGDAGNYFLDAGSTVTLTWNDPPLDSARFDFTILDNSGIPIVIGTDIDSADGVSVQWIVPAGLSGYEVGGIAYSAIGKATYFAYGGIVYSHEVPPQGVCTLANNTIGAIPIHLEPNPSAQVFANLIGGQYVQVYERKADDWYRIDASKFETYRNTTLSCGESPSSPCQGYSDSRTGWIQAKGNVRFFGPCDQFSSLNELEQSPSPVPSPESSHVENPTLSSKVEFPTEIPTTSANEQTGVRIYGRVSKNDGSNLLNVRIFLSRAAYHGDVIAMIDESGDFQSGIKFIPSDENITVWTELQGYSFTPSNYHWRHYQGYEDQQLNFTAAVSLSP